MADRNQVAAITAAARQMRQPNANANANADDAEVIRSLKSMGLINGETSVPEHETAKQTESRRATDAEIIESLKAMGMIGDDK